MSDPEWAKEPNDDPASVDKQRRAERESAMNLKLQESDRTLERLAEGAKVGRMKTEIDREVEVELGLSLKIIRLSKNPAETEAQLAANRMHRLSAALSLLLDRAEARAKGEHYVENQGATANPEVITDLTRGLIEAEREAIRRLCEIGISAETTGQSNAPNPDNLVLRARKIALRMSVKLGCKGQDWDQFNDIGQLLAQIDSMENLLVRKGENDRPERTG